MQQQHRQPPEALLQQFSSRKPYFSGAVSFCFTN